MAETPCYLLGAGSRPVPLRQGDVLTIGRDQQNAIFLDDVLASRWHASISFNGPQDILLTDLNSTNRTFLNGEPIAPRQPKTLKNGDLIRIGGKILYFVSDSGAMEPRKAALRSAKYLTQMDTVASGFRFNEGQVICEGPDGKVLESKTIAIPRNQNQEPGGSSSSGALDAALAGQLSEQNIPQILQFLFQNQKTGELHIQTGRITGLMAFRKGEIEYAEAGSLRGLHALYACARPANGAFRFITQTQLPDRPRNVEKSMMEIVFQCCKRMDDEAREQEGG